MTVVGNHPKTGRAVAIEASDGVITALSPTDSPADRYVSPGWVDLQVNGFAGVDYNDPSSPPDEIARSIDVQRSTGVARFCPTVITGSHTDMSGSLRNLTHAKRSLRNGRAMIGFHVEGPWISPLDGPRGAHPKAHVRPPSIEEFQRLQDAAEGEIALVTLSPEHEEAPGVIQHMVESGVIVAIGHTAATVEQIDAAVAAGATMSTHLGNGAHSTVPRHDNYIVHQMADDRLYAGLILDGIHLPPPFARIALCAKGPDLSVLVTDAVMPAHCEPGIYRLGEQQVELMASRRVELLDGRRLAGSALSMDIGIGKAMQFGSLSIYQATRLASSNPGTALGLVDRSGYLDPGQAADFTLFRLDDAGTPVDIRTVLSHDTPRTD